MTRRKVEKAVVILKRENDQIGFIENREETFGKRVYGNISLPVGYVQDGKFTMANQHEMSDESYLSAKDTEVLIPANGFLDDGIAAIIAQLKENENEMSQFETSIVWIDEEEAFEKLKETVKSGRKFIYGLKLDEISSTVLWKYLDFKESEKQKIS